MMRTKTLLAHGLIRCGLAAVLLGALLAAMTPANASKDEKKSDTASCWISYSDYEPNFPHVDLAACPDAPKDETVFCRARLAGDSMTIDRFRQADGCLLGSATTPIADFIKTYGPNPK